LFNFVNKPQLKSKSIW